MFTRLDGPDKRVSLQKLPILFATDAKDKGMVGWDNFQQNVYRNQVKGFRHSQTLPKQNLAKLILKLGI